MIQMNNVKIIRLREGYDWIRVVSDDDEDYLTQNNTITNSQLELLHEKWGEIGLDTKSIYWENRAFKFINYVGYLQVQDLALEILPKVSIHDDFHTMRKALIEMINTCYELDILVDYASNSLENGDLQEILSRYYASVLVKEMHRGITQQYQFIEDNRTSLKGQLIVSDHIRQNILNNKPYQVSVSYEERVENYNLNQLFKRATNVLLKTVRSYETKKQLQQIDYMLDKVDHRPFTKSQLDEINLNRTNIRFEKPFKLAKQFLVNETMSMQHNAFSKTFVIMFKMNDLFEAYIAILLDGIVNRPVYVQDERHRLFKNELTNNGIFQLKPDIVIGDREQIIIDTKWKQVFSKDMVNRSGVNREDLYQMYAYLTRYEHASAGILLYPKVQLNEGEYLFLQSWKLDNKKGLLRVYTVSLIDRETTENELIKLLNDICTPFIP